MCHLPNCLLTRLLIPSRLYVYSLVFLIFCSLNIIDCEPLLRCCNNALTDCVPVHLFAIALTIWSSTSSESLLSPSLPAWDNLWYLYQIVCPALMLHYLFTWAFLFSQIVSWGFLNPNIYWHGVLFRWCDSLAQKPAYCIFNPFLFALLGSTPGFMVDFCPALICVYIIF